MTPANLVTILRANLTDDRMYGVQLFIERLLKRTRHGDGIAQYRIVDTTNASDITSLADFSNAIAEANVVPAFPWNGEGMSSDRVVGFDVLLKNLEVNFHPLSAEDEVFSRQYDFGQMQKYQFMLHVAYMNDGDEVLPLKVYWIRLVRKS